MSTKAWKLYLFLLVLALISVWIAVFSISASKLKVITCDVGQGDAILVSFKATQILIDGGKPGKVDSCLSKYMPFWDRTIELVVISHPQLDHFGGLINVFENYNIKNILTSGLEAGSQEWSVLEKLVDVGDTTVHYAINGQEYGLGLIYLDIVHPSEEFITQNTNDYLTDSDSYDVKVLGAFDSKKDPNLFSITMILRYKDFKALFTGDINPSVSDLVADEILRNDLGPVNYIKIPHHGSKNGISEKLLDIVKPGVAVISVSENNSYGHPHKEVLKLLSNKEIKTLRTDLGGDIVLFSDGKKWLLER